METEQKPFVGRNLAGPHCSTLDGLKVTTPTVDRGGLRQIAVLLN